MRAPRYVTYKDSGVPWLGEVPEHWKIKPFFGIASERSEANKGMLEDNLLSLSYGRIVQKDIESKEGLLPESFETYQIVQPGDIVFRLTDLQNDKRSLRTAIVEQKGIITSAYLAATPVGMLPKYLNYLLRAYDTTKVFYSMGGGLRQSMKFSDIKHLPVLQPSAEEQSVIAAILDRETAKIDALVEEQRRLIELLKEKRQAIISHAVTKGLNPAAPLKDSGVRWLGRIPSHWVVVQSRRYFAERNEKAQEADVQLTASQRHGVIFQHEFMEIEGQKVVQVIKGGDILKHVEPNDFVISMRSFQGGIEWCGRRGCISSAYVMLTPSSSVEPLFFSYLLKSKVYIQALQATSNLVRDGQALRFDNFAQVRLPLLPLAEQSSIANFLQRETAKIDALTTEAERAVDLLQERRTALISAAVTGKIDLRGSARGQVA